MAMMAKKKISGNALYTLRPSKTKPPILRFLEQVHFFYPITYFRCPFLCCCTLFPHYWLSFLSYLLSLNLVSPTYLHYHHFIPSFMSTSHTKMEEENSVPAQAQKCINACGTQDASKCQRGNAATLWPFTVLLSNACVRPLCQSHNKMYSLKWWHVSSKKRFFL